MNDVEFPGKYQVMRAETFRTPFSLDFGFWSECTRAEKEYIWRDCTKMYISTVLTRLEVPSSMISHMSSGGRATAS